MTQSVHQDDAGKLIGEVVGRCGQVRGLDLRSMDRAQARLNDLTKPLGSLGTLEKVLCRLSGMTGKVTPTIHQPAGLIFAADHGISGEGVSAYGAEVTEEMVVNICMGSAVSSVLARREHVPLTVVDVGVKSCVRHPSAINRKVNFGTRNFLNEPAMTLLEAAQCVTVGIEMADRLISAGHDLVLIGEMGIGNTTTSSAMLSALLSESIEKLVGLGTGITEEKKLVKRDLILQAIEKHNPTAEDSWGIMTKVGGYEIGAMAGAIIAYASRGVPVLLDGLITGTAALWACSLNPQIKDWLIASHLSPEPAHAYVLDRLKLDALFDWSMRLGEGSGALFALPILRNACCVMAETATFEDARVTNPHIVDQKHAGVSVKPVEVQAPTPNDFSRAEQEALYKAILARRDIRSFLSDSLPEDVLRRILLAAHHAPSVGYMQPWNFIVIEDEHRRAQLQAAVERERVRAAADYHDLKQDYYLRLKVEGILQAPLSICVTNDGSRGGPHVLGRNTIPETDLMSTSCAIENMWLAARVEGVGMGWVSIYEKHDVRRILGIPDHVDPVALLSLGYTAHFPEIPLLERVGWGERLNIETLVFQDKWGVKREARLG